VAFFRSARIMRASKMLHLTVLALAGRHRTGAGDQVACSALRKK